MSLPDKTDPRLDTEYVREIAGSAERAPTTLVGVVHDHPASVYRVKTVVGQVEADVLALELPPLAVPLFERYARDTQEPPRDGGEMSAAIQASEAPTVVGIDGPSPRFFTRLLHRMRNESLSPRATIRLARDVSAGTATALRCAVHGRILGHATRWMPRDRGHDHDIDRLAPPSRQAAHERARIDRSRVASRVLTSSPASDCLDRAREEQMVAELDRLRRTGSVIAVVGLAHLDRIASRLCDTTERNA